MVFPSLKRLPAADRPRERLRSVGREALSDVELVALVIGGDLECATEIVSAVGGARGIRRAVVHELETLHGVGPARASQLVAALELGRRAGVSLGPRGDALKTPAHVAAYLGDLALLEIEELHVLAVDGRHRLIAQFVAARGALNVVHVTPRDVYRRLVREGAAAAIVAHNHPSGDPTPSAEDLVLTQRLRDAGDLIGVVLLDHIIIAAAGFHSFADTIGRPAKR